MGHPRRTYFDSPAIDRPSTYSRLVAFGLVYVCYSLGFMLLAITIGVALGPRILDHKMLSFGVAGIAAVLVMAGVFLLVAFFFRPLASRAIQEFSSETSQSGDLWDEQLDG